MQAPDKVAKAYKRLKGKPKQTKQFVVRAFARGLSSPPHIDTTKVLESLGPEILKRVRAQVRQTAFSKAAKRRLAKAIKIEVGAKSLKIVSVDPLWNYLVKGQKKGPMKWLLKARAPIPIVTESGKVIFRSATARSLSSGKWIHPGRPALDVTSAAVKASRDLIKKRLNRAVVAQIRAAMGQ